MDTADLLELQRAVEETVRSTIRTTLRELGAPACSSGLDGGPPQAGPDYLSVNQAARRISAHPATVRKLIARGKLRRYTVGSSVRVRSAELDELLRADSSLEPAVSIAQRASEILCAGPSRRNR